MRRLGEGDKSEVFALEDGRVLKLFRPQYAALAEEEARLSDVLASAGVLAPRVDEIREIEGRPALVFGNLPVGETLSRAVRRRPWRLPAAARELARLHADVHERKTTELPAQRTRMKRQIEAASILSSAAREAALATLNSLPDANVVCHNDVHMLNVIVHPRGTMIIDWVLASRGNPLADVATAELQLGYGETPRSPMAREAVMAARAIFRRLYRRQYLRWRPGGAVVDELDRWRLPAAAALVGRREGAMQRQLLVCIERCLNDWNP